MQVSHALVVGEVAGDAMLGDLDQLVEVERPDPDSAVDAGRCELRAGRVERDGD